MKGDKVSIVIIKDMSKNLNMEGKVVKLLSKERNFVGDIIRHGKKYFLKA